MSEVMKKELDVKESEITSTVVKDTCFVNIPEDEIKLKNTEIQGNLNTSISCKLYGLTLKK